MENNTNFIHQRIYNDLLLKIKNHEFNPGDKLPKEIELMVYYNCSRHSIRRATEKLVQDGYIYTVKGNGTYVREKKSEYLLSQMSSFSEILGVQEGKPNSIIYEARELDPKPEIAKELGLSEGESVYYIERVRRNGKLTLCFEKVYINKKLCPNIINHINPYASLFDLYENKYNLKLEEGNYKLEAINAEQKLAKILDIEVNAAILLMSATINTNNGTKLYHVNAYYIGSRYIFNTRLKR